MNRIGLQNLVVRLQLHLLRLPTTRLELLAAAARARIVTSRMLVRLNRLYRFRKRGFVIARKLLLVILFLIKPAAKLLLISVTFCHDRFLLKP